MPSKNSQTAYLSFQGSEARLAIKVQPRAKKTEIKGVHDGKIKIGIHAAPVDGKANDELIHYLSKSLGCPKGEIRIHKGETSKEKIIAISGNSAKKVAEWLRIFNL